MFSPAYGKLTEYRMAVKFSGVIKAIAYVDNKNTISSAIHAIKSDIIRALKFRFDLLCEELARQESNSNPISEYFNALESVKNPTVGEKFPLPKRIFFPVNFINLSDLLLPNETLEDSAERCSAMLNITPPSNLDTWFSVVETFPGVK